MAAWHHLNTDQTGYWVDPEEHIANLKHSNDAEWRAKRGQGLNTMWNEKEDEAREPVGFVHGSGVYDSLMAGEPIRRAVPLEYDPDAQPGDETWRTSPRQIDGHHRMAAARAAQRELGTQVRVPVEFVPPRAPKRQLPPQPLPQMKRLPEATYSPDSGSSGIGGLVAAINAVGKGKSWREYEPVGRSSEWHTFPISG